jgi:hypothetical protein
MSKADIYWTGASGKKYGYWIHAIDTEFRKIAGNSIFARPAENGEWVPVYIGQTRNFDVGLTDDAEKMACARQNGATHVHTHFSSPDEPIRRAEMEDLAAKWKPVCNSSQ